MWFHMWHIDITYKFLYKLSQYSAIPTVLAEIPNLEPRSGPVQGYWTWTIS